MIPRDERQLLLRRLAKAAAKRSEPPLPDAPPVGSFPMGPEGRASRFAQAFEEAGGKLFRGPVEPVMHDLAEELRAEGVTALFFPEDDGEARDIAMALAPFGPFALAACAEARGGIPEVTAGFRTAEAGIAETGSIVESSAGNRTLLPGLLADVSVTLLPASSLYDRMEDALAALCADPPRNVSLCTGPSRTADIEQTITVGAHGPRKAIVVLV
ncbi:MAG: LUD domain-containing protein [Thermodesulfobacteriota bacterium]